MRINKLTEEEFRILTCDAAVLMSDKNGIKVLQTPERKIIKLYRLKRRFSSALIYPYALRFLRNSLILKKRGIATVDVESVYSVPGIKRDIVIYPKLAGTVLRDALKNSDRDLRKTLLEHFAAFVAALHENGIFFRSIHFGNIVVQPDGTFALIDIGDMRFNFFRGLTLRQRLRNFRHMCRYENDTRALSEFGMQSFIEKYTQNSAVEGVERWLLKNFLLRAMDRYHHQNKACP